MVAPSGVPWVLVQFVVMGPGETHVDAITFVVIHAVGIVIAMVAPRPGTATHIAAPSVIGIPATPINTVPAIVIVIADRAITNRIVIGVITANAALGIVIAVPLTVAIVIGIAPPSATTVTTATPGTIVTAAMGNFTPSPSGWPSSLAPVPTAASIGSSPFVARDGGVVVPPSTSVGDNGGGDEDAAAPTTRPIDAVTAASSLPSTTCPVIPSPVHDIRSAPIVHNSNTHALLPMTMFASQLSSARGRDHSSEGLQGVRQYVGHPPPPPTVAVDRAAQRGVGRTTAFANTALATTLPRPGPASLLPPSWQPQQGRRAQRGGRVGGVPRAARKAGSDATGSGVARPVAVALTVSLVAMKVVRRNRW